MTTATTGSSMIETAAGLRDVIASYSDEADLTRRLPEPVVQLLRDNGFIGMAFPSNRGGMGLDLVTTLRVVEEISAADASTGWCTAIGSGSIGALPLEESAAREIYAPGSFVCGAGAPTGRATAVEGGYRVSGRWPYASGCLHADWIFLNSIEFDGDAPVLAPGGGPQLRMSVLPIAEVEIIDVWNVSGLRATGSNDVALTDAFVPAARTVTIDLGSTRTIGDDYRIPMFTVFGLALAPVATGTARRAIDELLALQGKTPRMANATLREKPIVQYEIARATGMLEAGRAYMYEMVRALEDRIMRREEIDMDLRAHIRLAMVHAVDSATQAIEIAYRLGGGTSNFETSPLQRCLRDVHAVSQHVVLAAPNYETVGRVLMGLDPATPLL